MQHPVLLHCKLLLQGQCFNPVCLVKACSSNSSSSCCPRCRIGKAANVLLHHPVLMHYMLLLLLLLQLLRVNRPLQLLPHLLVCQHVALRP
jgi:hypothetical protein